MALSTALQRKLVEEVYENLKARGIAVTKLSRRTERRGATHEPG